MTQVLLDTHTWVWSLLAETELSKTAAAAITDSDAVFVSPISFFEIGQKVRLGKWPEMSPFVHDLPELLQQQGGPSATLSPEVALHASLRDWAHRDPFDRLLASTAELQNLILVSKDIVLDELDGVKRVW